MNKLPITKRTAAVTLDALREAIKHLEVLYEQVKFLELNYQTFTIVREGTYRELESILQRLKAVETQDMDMDNVLDCHYDTGKCMCNEVGMNKDMCSALHNLAKSC